MKKEIKINKHIRIIPQKYTKKPKTELLPKECYYDEPQHIYEIIEETHELKELIQKYQDIINNRIGKEKIRTFNKKRWTEYQEKHKYRMTPTQEMYYYNENPYNRQ